MAGVAVDVVSAGVAVAAAGAAALLVSEAAAVRASCAATRLAARTVALLTSASARALDASEAPAVGVAWEMLGSLRSSLGHRSRSSR